MAWQETHTLLRETLRAELRKQWGRIAEIEDRVSCSKGHLNKLSSGANEFKLDVFLKTLDALEIDPRSFFSRALGIYPTPDDYLKEIVEDAEDDPGLARIVRATRYLESADPPAGGSPELVSEGELAEFLGCSVTEQRRRLRHTLKYRNHVFAEAYLSSLETLLYDDAVKTAKLAETVAVDFVPALCAPQRGRWSLQCRAIGIFGTSRRLKGRFSSAARALSLGIELSRQHGLRSETARLQQRAAYVLRDFGHYERALALLGRAMVKFIELDSKQDVGKVLIDRGMMHSALGDYETAVLSLNQGLRELEDSPDELSRSRLAAYQYLAYAFEQLGDLDAAEQTLARGARSFGSRHAVDQAKLQWLRGTMAYKRRDLPASEALLREARSVLVEHENPMQGAMVTLDLVNTLLARGKHSEAVDQSKRMAELLARFRGNRIFEGAVMEFVAAVLEGRLSQELIAQARTRLESGRAPRRADSKSRSSAGD